MNNSLSITAHNFVKSMSNGINMLKFWGFIVLKTCSKPLGKVILKVFRKEMQTFHNLSTLDKAINLLKSLFSLKQHVVLFTETLVVVLFAERLLLSDVTL